jgi:hypothetical protein
VVGHTCSPSAWEAEAEGLQIGGQTGYIVIPCLKKQKDEGKGQRICEMNNNMKTHQSIKLTGKVSTWSNSKYTLIL